MREVFSDWYGSIRGRPDSNLGSACHDCENSAVNDVRPSPPIAALPRDPENTAFGESERFVERGLIGRGGMGSVIRALDKDLYREVAIKVLDADVVGGGSGVARFAEEARITGQLEHPNIVPVYEFGVDEQERRFLCMKLVQGETLEAALNRSGASRLDPDRLADLLQVFLKVCDAVSFAHS